jgi:hypothetical protein
MYSPLIQYNAVYRKYLFAFKPLNEVFPQIKTILQKSEISCIVQQLLTGRGNRLFFDIAVKQRVR